MAYGKVIGGKFVNSTTSISMKGVLSLSPAGFKRTPNLTEESVNSWEEVPDPTRGGKADAVSKISQAVSRAAIPGFMGKTAAAAVGSAVESVTGNSRTIRVDWVEGGQSLIRLPDDQFVHLTMVLGEKQIGSSLPPPEPASTESPADVDSATRVISGLTRLAGVVRGAPTEISDQIAQLSELRASGVLTEAEFAAKKAALLGIDSPSISSSSPPPPPRPAIPPPPGSPAAWAADPTGRHEHRYWDGESWTENVSNGGVQGVDPY